MTKAEANALAKTTKKLAARSSEITNKKVSSSSSGSYPEDFSFENGQYHCVCISCNKMFLWHKRRVICKLCLEKNDEP